MTASDIALIDRHPVSDEKREAIVRALKDIERQHNVRILYACESGSRGWGFASVDSDYDVRFIYVHPQSWYLTLDERAKINEPQRDVIETPISADLDIQGWDLRKVLRLIGRSNPTVLEWLRSPIIYRDSEIVEQLHALAVEYFSKNAWHHYAAMARKTAKVYLSDEQVKLKKYFYALRPLLACQYIEQTGQPPPMVFEELLDTILPDGPVREEIDRLLAYKRQTGEKEPQARIQVLDDWIHKAIAGYGDTSGFGPEPQHSIAKLDDFFRKALIPTEATDEMCDSVKQILQAMKQPSQTFGGMIRWCNLAGMDIHHWPSWILDPRREKEHFNKEASALLLWHCMARAAQIGFTDPLYP